MKFLCRDTFVKNRTVFQKVSYYYYYYYIIITFGDEAQFSIGKHKFVRSWCRNMYSLKHYLTVSDINIVKF